MSEPYVGQIIFAGFNFAPQGYALCDGATLLVQQNAALFSLIGAVYGGDGKANFKIPDLRGRTYLGAGMFVPSNTLYPIGQSAGSESVILTAAQLPAHTHTVNAATAPGTVAPGKGVPSTTGGASAGSTTNMYAAPGATVALNGLSVSDVGGSAGHPNMQPFQVVSAAIAVVGYYPQRP